jgi:pyruvate kinase
MRKTKIICTLGPACDDEEMLRKMIKNGVEFYALKEANALELLNINHYEDYLKIKKEINKN